MKASDSQISRLKSDLERISGESLFGAEQVDSTIYFYGSELATLRLLKHYRHSIQNVVQGYSENLNTFYFGIYPKGVKS